MDIFRYKCPYYGLNSTQIVHTMDLFCHKCPYYGHLLSYYVLLTKQTNKQRFKYDNKIPSPQSTNTNTEYRTLTCFDARRIVFPSRRRPGFFAAFAFTCLSTSEDCRLGMEDVPFAAGELATASFAGAGYPKLLFRRRHRRWIWQQHLWLWPRLVEKTRRDEKRDENDDTATCIYTERTWKRMVEA
jgi:hypothetical protein